MNFSQIRTKLIRRYASYILQLPRIYTFRILSVGCNVCGKARLLQPVLFTGAGKIIIGEQVTMGFQSSPYFYSGYIHIESRRPYSSIRIGNNVWMNNSCVLISEGEGIEIGSRSLLGTNVEIIDSDFHELHPKRRVTGVPLTAPVIIGRNVFVGSNVRILKGVTIGENSVIANSSVVVSSIPSDVIAGGNPARVIKKIEY